MVSISTVGLASTKKPYYYILYLFIGKIIAATWLTDQLLMIGVFPILFLKILKNHECNYFKKQLHTEKRVQGLNA